MFTRAQLILTFIACLICLAYARPERRLNKRNTTSINLASGTMMTASSSSKPIATHVSTKHAGSSVAKSPVPTAAPTSTTTTSYSSNFVFTYSLKDTTPLADGRLYLSLYPSMASSSRSSKSAAKASSKASKKAAKSKSSSDDDE